MDDVQELRDLIYGLRDKINENENRISVLEFDLRDQKRVTDRLDTKLRELDNG